MVKQIITLKENKVPPSCVAAILFHRAKHPAILLARCVLGSGVTLTFVSQPTILELYPKHLRGLRACHKITNRVKNLTDSFIWAKTNFITYFFTYFNYTIHLLLFLISERNLLLLDKNDLILERISEKL